jgi:hypothetical protein
LNLKSKIFDTRFFSLPKFNKVTSDMNPWTNMERAPTKDVNDNSSNMSDQERRSLLKDEYLHIQQIIEGFDARVITIKAWSVSTSLAGIGGAFAAHSAPVLLMASISSLLFWSIEAVWKTFQYAHYKRSSEIEKFFAGLEKNLTPMQIGAKWYQYWKEGGTNRLLTILLWPHVALPHVVIFVAGLALYALVILGIVAIN